MSMRIVASVQLKYKQPHHLTEVLLNVAVPQNWEKTAGLDIPGETQHKKTIQDKHTCNARRLLRLRDVAQQPR